jgi:hypothetical protein
MAWIGESRRPISGTSAVKINGVICRSRRHLGYLRHIALTARMNRIRRQGQRPLTTRVAMDQDCPSHNSRSHSRPPTGCFRPIRNLRQRAVLPSEFLRLLLHLWPSIFLLERTSKRQKLSRPQKPEDCEADGL